MWMCVAAAFAQGRQGLIDDPDYERYALTVEDLGLPLGYPDAIGPQIAIGTMGVVAVGGTTVGYVLAIRDPQDYTRALETFVLFDAATVESINATGFTITFHDVVQPGVQSEVDEELEQLALQDVADAYVAAEATVAHKTLPDTNGPGLQLVTPQTNPDHLDLLGFRLRQGGETVGWMLRERRDLGVYGIQWVDHWWYTEDYSFVDGPNEAVRMEPTGVDPGSITTFRQSFDEDCPGHAPLAHYQQGKYTYSPL